MLQYRIGRMETLLQRLAALIGGRPAPTPRRLQTAQDVIDLLEEQIEALRAAPGLGAVERARAIGYLAGLGRQAIETGTLAARVEALEAARKRRDQQDSE
jgi:hypothetical protein